jgi:hypothetical protein
MIGPNNRERDKCQCFWVTLSSGEIVSECETWGVPQQPARRGKNRERIKPTATVTRAPALGTGSARNSEGA